MLFSPGLEQFDPALLAFVKCHVTSPARWEVLRTLANQDGGWLGAQAVARVTHRPELEVTQTLAELTADGLVEGSGSGTGTGEVSYRLPADEPTSIVLHRLIQAATHNLELRAIIAAHLQHVRWDSTHRAGGPLGHPDAGAASGAARGVSSGEGGDARSIKLESAQRAAS